MKAVIMAGGEGTRLRPLTCNVPKPMVPVANRPVMEHIIELALKHGIKDLAVTLQYLPGVIKRHFGDGPDFGVNIKYFVEENPLGTAGSVRSASGFLDETFAVISGDAFTNMDISDAVKFHYEKKAVVTLILKKVKVPLEYGVVITDSDCRIIRFLEKPGWSEVFSNIANTGIYIMSPEIFKYIEKGEKLDFSKDIFPKLMELEVPLYGYTTDRYWCDIGDMDAYMEVHRDIMDGKVDAVIRGNEISKGIWVDENCSISKDAVLEGPCIIGKNNLVGSNARIGPYSVLGDSNFIGAGSSVNGSIIWNRCLMNTNCNTEEAIICNRVILGKGAAVLDGAVIGDGTFVGEESLVKQGIKVWPGKNIEQGTVLSVNVVTGKGPMHKVFRENGVNGRIGMDMTPEFSARLGAAFVSALPGNVKIAAGCDGDAASGMIKDSLCSGMLSAGAEIIDLGKTTPAVSRLGTCFFNCGGGVFVGKKVDDPGAVSIDFIDKKGVNIGRELERRIENLLSRDEFNRIAPERIRNTRRIPGFMDFYYRMFTGRLKSGLLDFNMVIISGNEAMNDIIRQICEEKGCNAEIISGDAKGRFDNPKWLIERVKRKKLDLGVMVDCCPEKIILIDSKGRIISEEMLTALAALIVFKKNNGGSIVAPVSASSALEEIALKHNGKVIRKKIPGGLFINLGFEKTGNAAGNAADSTAGSAAGSSVKSVAGSTAGNAAGSIANKTSGNAAGNALDSTAGSAAGSVEGNVAGNTVSSATDSAVDTAVENELALLCIDPVSFLFRVLDFLKEAGISLDVLVDSIPEIHMSRRQIDCPPDRKGIVIKSIMDEHGGGRIETIEGVKIYNDYGWVLVLPDAEKPVCRIISEAATQEFAEELTGIYAEKIRKYSRE